MLHFLHDSHHDGESLMAIHEGVACPFGDPVAAQRRKGGNLSKKKQPSPLPCFVLVSSMLYYVRLMQHISNVGQINPLKQPRPGRHGP
jgi:hypothetical protein